MVKRKNAFIPYIFGAIIGFINGFFGGGGGMVAVPLLERAYSYKEKNAHATSIAIILPVTVVSAAVYLFSVNVLWDVLLVCSAGVTAGGILGALLLKKTDNAVIGYIFCIVMLIAGVKMAA